MSMHAAHAIFPLSLLEAMRNLDRPVDDGVDGINQEVVAIRLGLSATVAAQIARYTDLARRGRRVPAEEVASVFRLVVRRPDAELVLADAGRRAARHAARSTGFPRRALRRAAPGGLGLWFGARDASRLSRRVFGTRLSVGSGGAEARLEAFLDAGDSLGAATCAFYGAALHELLRFLTGFEGSLEHSSCRIRGQDACRWRSLMAEEYQ